MADIPSGTLEMVLNQPSDTSTETAKGPPRAPRRQRPPPPPPSPALQVPAAAVTAVTAADQLQDASQTGQQDIEIQDHLDLRVLGRIRNPANPARMVANDAAVSQGLLYTHGGMRSLRGNCSDPDAAAALGLSPAEASAMLPLKPRQCVVLVPDTFLVSNGGSFWLDNVYLKLMRTRTVHDFAFVAGGTLGGSDEVPEDVATSNLYVTNVTLQGESRGAAMGITTQAPEASLLLQDCIVTDWRGSLPPLDVARNGIANVVDTVFRNLRLSSVLVDVSDNGVVRFHNAALANVTLTGGSVVSTAKNDVEVDSSSRAVYDATDDDSYDVELTPVPVGEQGMFGEEFVIEDAVMSDCLYRHAAAGAVQPGCPPASAQKRAELIKSEYAELTVGTNITNSYVPAPDLYETRLLSDVAPWLLEVRAALKPLPPPPPGWPDFNSTQPHAPAERANVTMPLPVPPGVLWSSFQTAPAPSSQPAGRRVVDESSLGLVVAALVVAVAAAIALGGALWAARSLRRPPAPEPIVQAAALTRQRCSEVFAWISGDSDEDSNAAYVRTSRGSLDVHPRSVQASISSRLHSSCSMPESAMNPEYEYSLPTHLAELMAGPIFETEEGAPQDEGKAKASMHSLTSARCDSSCGIGHPQSGVGPMLSLLATQLSGRALVSHGSYGSSASRTGGYSTELARRSLSDRPLLGRTKTPATAVTVTSSFWNSDMGSNIVTSTRSSQCGAAPTTRRAVFGWRWQGAEPAAGQGQEAAGIHPGRARESPCELRRRGDTAVSASAAHIMASATDASAREKRIRRLHRLLDAFEPDDLLLGRFELLGCQERRRGGQAVVQFAQGSDDRCEYAIKFFLDYSAFLTEAALYAACFPRLRATISDEVIARSDATAESGADGQAAVPLSQVAVSFLPQVEAVCDGSAGGLEDPRGRWLPPCIVMEKGESLQDWSDRAHADLFTSLAVLSNISTRLADMHEAGYVHRDLKPGNVMWLPRQNRWTIIDFGCVARIGAEAPLSFTLAYAAPEVACAFTAGQHVIESSAALDAWSLGVMAFELLTGAPAFNLLRDGRAGVIARLKGEMPLPWEGDLSSAVAGHLGSFQVPVLQLLHRDPARRISMRRFHIACNKLFTSRTTVEA